MGQVDVVKQWTPHKTVNVMMNVHHLVIVVMITAVCVHHQVVGGLEEPPMKSRQSPRNYGILINQTECKTLITSSMNKPKYPRVQVTNRQSRSSRLSMKLSSTSHPSKSSPHCLITTRSTKELVKPSHQTKSLKLMPFWITSLRLP